MRVCHIGVSDPDYSRNRVIIDGLRQNGVTVFRCNAYSSDLKETLPSPARYVKKYIKLIEKHAELNYDVLVTGYSGQIVMPLVELLTRKPIVLDAFLGMHEMFLDLKPERSNSWEAKFWYYLDAFSLKSANLILSDTNEHIKYFHSQFKTPEFKFKRVFVGSDDKIFFPRSTRRQNDDFVVMFWGTFIPLQGVEYIVQAAKLLESHKNIRFEIIGSGRTFNHVQNLSKELKSQNVHFFTKWIPYSQLPNYIAEADICLGIFGCTPKANRVIPNKVFETLAMKKPLITSDSPAVREALTNLRDCVLCQPANPEAIAESIMLLIDDEALRKRIATNGYNLFKTRFTSRVIGEGLRKSLDEYAMGGKH